MVTADLPAFVRPGDRIDVTVSSFGDARSLRAAFAANASGGGRRARARRAGARVHRRLQRAGRRLEVQRNHTAVGIVPGGAIVERSVPAEVLQGDRLTLILHEPDFTTAARVAEAINRVFTRIRPGRWTAAPSRCGCRRFS